MSDHIVPYFQNSCGESRVEIGAKKFMCVGANPPFDHPHIFLDMGHEDEKICPYCSTHYVCNEALGETETIPAGCLLETDQA